MKNILGNLPTHLNSKTDWENIRTLARKGQLDQIDADIYVRHYTTLKRIALDHIQHQEGQRECVVFWGPTGTGKSHRAWQEAGMDAYPKQPCTKWWDGYQPEKHNHVVIDEFDGQIGITHLLRWFDKYPCQVEQKGGGCVLKATKIWITSNIDPREWYPQGKRAQVEALLRRLSITHLPFKYNPPPHNPWILADLLEDEEE